MRYAHTGELGGIGRAKPLAGLASAWRRVPGLDRHRAGAAAIRRLAEPPSPSGLTARCPQRRRPPPDVGLADAGSLEFGHSTRQRRASTKARGHEIHEAFWHFVFVIFVISCPSCLLSCSACGMSATEPMRWISYSLFAACGVPRCQARHQAPDVLAVAPVVRAEPILERRFLDDRDVGAVDGENRQRPVPPASPNGCTGRCRRARR